MPLLYMRIVLILHFLSINLVTLRFKLIKSSVEIN